MPRRASLSPEQETELAGLRERCVALLQALERAGCATSTIAAQMQELIERIAEKRSLRAMRDMLRELRAWQGAMPPEIRVQVDAELRARFGPDADAQRDEVVVEKVRARGRIRTEREYRIVSAYADSLSGDPKNEEEYLRLGRLLDAFMAGA